jgi:hypothetical protein
MQGLRGERRERGEMDRGGRERGREGGKTEGGEEEERREEWRGREREGRRRRRGEREERERETLAGCSSRKGIVVLYKVRNALLVTFLLPALWDCVGRVSPV